MAAGGSRGGGRRRDMDMCAEGHKDDTYSKEDLKGLKYGATVPFGLAREEEFLVCPFDPLHVVPSSSFFKHKLKCERKMKERLGIPDAFNEMQYRNRLRSSIANSKPLPKPPMHCANLTDDPYFAQYYGTSSLAAAAAPAPNDYATLAAEAAAVEVPGRRPAPGTSGTAAASANAPPILELLMADSNLRYFEPSGLTPAMRKEFRNRRHAAVAATTGYRDLSKEGPPSEPEQDQSTGDEASQIGKDLENMGLTKKEDENESEDDEESESEDDEDDDEEDSDSDDADDPDDDDDYIGSEFIMMDDD